ncbi:hypothetical protein [uncultured Sphaerotilus sp.]|uniref:hypothetical protein n=1 Tax=uncultured Sphaerotilus sp. TaxID=474984 RepID=UPI0030CA3D53
MATKNTAGKAAGQAAALPTADLLRSVAHLAGELDTLHSRLKHDVSPLLRALENLTNCHRVLSGIEQAANRDKGFNERIAAAVEGWRDPMMDEPLELVGDLARVAVNVFIDHQTEAEALVSRAYALANQTGGAAA